VANPFSAYTQSKPSSSFRLGQVFGITVQIHWMWFLLPLLFVGYGPGGFITGTLVLIGLFGIVFLHELGHCMAARHYGIQVIDITFWPLGGMARMSELPEDSKIEGVIAAAGPLVNFALAALAVPVIIGLGLMGLEAPAALAVGFVEINLVLGGFNLIPAFPMDGGRILRAYLAHSRDWVTATEMAVKTGRIATIVMVLGALYFYRGPSLCIIPLIAGFIWFAGARELWAVRLRHGHSPFGGIPNASPFGSGQTSAAWAETEGSPFRSPPEFTGDVVPERQPGQGFSEDDLKRLENFHGRLRRRPDTDD